LSLQSRVITLVIGMLMLVAAVGVGLQALTLAQNLRVEQTARNLEMAQNLALAWAGTDAVHLQSLAAARFARGREDGIRVHTQEALALIKLHRVPSSADVPDWFARAWPLDAQPGRSALAVAGSVPAVLEVEVSMAWGHQLLWQTVSRSAALLALFAAAASLLATAVLRGWLLPWKLTIDPLQDLADARLAPLDETGRPDARTLVHRMNDTVRDLRQDLAAQAEQVLRLQRQAQVDTLTGVSLRHHFLAELQRRLAEPQRGHLALLIVRLRDLEALNLRAGHEATDRVLCALSHALLTYVDRVPGTLAGRLNGGDFALCLPVGGVALETAFSLRDALAALPALRNAGAQAVVGGVDELPYATTSLVLAEADAALARAEAGEAGGVAVDRHGDLVADTAGARAWRQQIAEALTQQRGRLETVPILDREGRTLHLACTLHLQWVAGAAHQPPRGWLALARRAQLLSRVDLLSVQLALKAIAADGQARCVRLSGDSWGAGGFVSEVQALLQAAPTQARSLSLVVPEPDSGDECAARSAALAAWAPTGVRLGLQQAAEVPLQLGCLQAGGISFVTLTAAHLRGVAAEHELKAYAQGLMQLVSDCHLLVLLDGTCDPQDLDVMWTLGLGGAAAPLAVV
jgi:GGDEF domain-containing protein